MICPSGRRDNESLIFLRLTEVIGAARLEYRLKWRNIAITLKTLGQPWQDNRSKMKKVVCGVSGGRSVG
jgi:hypothetical protein